MPRLVLPTAAAVVLAAAAAAPAQAASSGAAVSATPIPGSLGTKESRSTVTVRSTRSRLRGYSLTVGSAKGVRVRFAGGRAGRRSKALPTIKAEGSYVVGLRVRRSGRAAAEGSLTLRLRRKGRTVATGRVRWGGTAGSAPADPSSFAGRYFWGSVYTVSGIQQFPLYFSNAKFVSTGDIENGAFPTCAAASETCRPYAYDAKTRSLTIDGKPAALSGDTLEYDDQTHFELGTAKAGARWDVVLTYSNSTGVAPYQSFYTEYLTFRPDGTFIRSSVASGSGPVVDYGVVPPDSKGTYEVRADRTLRLSFADGKQRVETLGIFPDKSGAYPTNPTAGIVLDGDGYFDIRD